MGLLTSEESARTVEGGPARTCVQARMVAGGRGASTFVSMMKKEK